ncbi:putative F-box domain, kelch-type beta propeller, F-box-like domain superfamily [Helianthus anomalus]
MELTESVPEGSSQTVITQSSLISGLPDDIALTCLARIPRKYHSLLKCVSRKWRDLVCSEEWYTYRQKHNLSETWIYALCKDKSEQLCCYVLDPDLPKKGWKRIPDLSPRCLKRKGVGFEVLGKTIYFLGGCGWVEDATDEVYCYDASRNAWSEASPLSTPRCYFACEAMDGKMYAIGGLGSKSSDPHSWDTFDSTTNSWTSHMDPNIVPEIEDSLVLDGKIYIRCGLSAVSSHVYAVVYDPLNGTWQHADADMMSGWRGPGIVVENTLYVLDQSSGTRVMMWRKDSREWEAFGRLAAILTRPPCRLVAIGKKMFVVGKGLSTVVFDVDKAANIDGMLVTTSVPKLPSDDDVISCKSVSL